MDSPILVTGASGYLGGHLTAALKEGPAVAIGGRTALARAAAEQAAISYSADLADPETVASIIERHRPRAVIHAAALADAYRCENEPAAAARANIETTRCLLRALPPECLFVYISTDLVFDGTEAPPGGLTESALPIPRSVYARTKREAEELVRAAGRNHVVIRSALIYGPPSGDRRGVLGWMCGALESNEELTLFTDEFRTPIYIGDLVAIIREIVRTSDRGLAQPSLIHAGGPERCSRLDLGEKLAREMLVSQPKLVPLLRADRPLIPARPRDVSLCSDLAYSHYSLTRTALSDGLRKSINR